MSKPKVVALLARALFASSQLPVRLAMLLLTGFVVLSEKFGLESALGAFAAGMVVGLASRGEAGKPLREKMDALCFGFLILLLFPTLAGVLLSRTAPTVPPPPQRA